MTKILRVSVRWAALVVALVSLFTVSVRPPDPAAARPLDQTATPRAAERTQLAQATFDVYHYNVCGSHRDACSVTQRDNAFNLVKWYLATGQAPDGVWYYSVNEVCAEDMQSLSGVQWWMVISLHDADGCPGTDRRFGNGTVVGATGSCSTYIGGGNTVAQAENYEFATRNNMVGRKRILAGDFNLTPSEMPATYSDNYYGLVENLTHHARTGLTKQIDYMWLTRRDASAALFAPYCAANASDHCLTHAQITWTGP